MKLKFEFVESHGSSAIFKAKGELRETLFDGYIVKLRSKPNEKGVHEAPKEKHFNWFYRGKLYRKDGKPYRTAWDYAGPDLDSALRGARALASRNAD